MPTKKKTAKPAPAVRKTSLTFQEQITAAHLHFVQGLDQHIIAFAMGVNMGRINEACMAVRRGLLNAKHEPPAKNGSTPREAKHAGNDDVAQLSFARMNPDGENTKAAGTG